MNLSSIHKKLELDLLDLLVEGLALNGSDIEFESGGLARSVGPRESTRPPRRACANQG
jgi:hypothetical protein